MPKTIAIAGMGLCGNAAFCRLIRLLESLNVKGEEITIRVFEQNPKQLATGFAYSMDSPNFWTLNNLADGFKFIPGTDTLTQWIDANPDFIQRHYPNINKQYIPRSLVGHYLHAQYEKHKALAKSMKIVVEEIFTPISNVRHLQQDAYQIDCADASYKAEILFLTTGHLENHYFQTVEKEPGFIRLENTTNHELLDIRGEAYVIGGQAAFVDAALWLTLLKGYKGPIHSVTRSPAVITTKGNSDLCGTEAQSQLSEQLKKRKPGTLTFAEAQGLFWSAYQKDAKSPLDHSRMPGSFEALNYQMNKHDQNPDKNTLSGNVDELRAFIKTFYFSGCYTYMWQQLNDEGKAQFLNYFYSLMMAYLTGITPVNARLMLHLYEQNRVIEHHGLASVRYDSQTKQFELSFTNGDKVLTPTLIDATGYRYNLNPAVDNPMLLDQLARNGMLVGKPFGGIQLTDSFQAIDRQGNIQESLFCLGPVADYQHPVPTTHSSFMVSRDLELVMEKVVPMFDTVEKASVVVGADTEACINFLL